MSILISLMCHPENEPAISLPEVDGLGTFINRTPGYGDAVRFAIGAATAQMKGLVLADSDGYHPVEEITKLAAYPEADFIKPYRMGIGIQSGVYSLLYSTVKLRRIKDATGGLYRMSYGFMRSLPSLKARDMTINVEILNHASEVIQYGYEPGRNDRINSKRTKGYQLKLLRAML